MEKDTNISVRLEIDPESEKKVESIITNIQTKLEEARALANDLASLLGGLGISVEL